MPITSTLRPSCSEACAAQRRSSLAAATKSAGSWIAERGASCIPAADTSSSTPVGSSYDYATTYLRHVFGFLGITDVEVVAADKLAMDAEGSIKAANEAIDALVAKAA